MPVEPAGGASEEDHRNRPPDDFSTALAKWVSISEVVEGVIVRRRDGARGDDGRKRIEVATFKSEST